MRTTPTTTRRALDGVTLLGIDCVDIDRLVVVAEICQRHLQFERVRLLSHLAHDTPDLVPIDPITSKEQYSTFVIRELYRYIDTSHVLIIQWDGFVLNPAGWREAFLDYDYVGAPWAHRRDRRNVGNGGFSLRSRRLLEAIARAPGVEECHPEDHVICRTHGDYLAAQGFLFAPEHLARHFSVERAKWDGQFGFHQADISSWPIEQFLDRERHRRYLDLFFQIFPDARPVGDARETP